VLLEQDKVEEAKRSFERALAYGPALLPAARVHQATPAPRTLISGIHEGAPSLGFINLRVPHYFPEDKYPRLVRLWRAMEERDSFKKTAPPRG
jgi:hypothetical protein